MPKFRKATKTTIVRVLEAMIKQIKEDEEEYNQFAQVYSEEVDMMLDNLLNQDFFGTEGQLDPRGDHRD